MAGSDQREGPETEGTLKLSGPSASLLTLPPRRIDDMKERLLGWLGLLLGHVAAEFLVDRIVLLRNSCSAGIDLLDVTGW